MYRYINAVLTVNKDQLYNLVLFNVRSVKLSKLVILVTLGMFTSDLFYI
jgi:hypothetical protein